LVQDASKGVANIAPNTANWLGISERVVISGAAPAVTNGMVAPWMANLTDSHFLTYGELGFTNAGFNAAYAAGGSIPTTYTGVERLWLNTTAPNLAVGGTVDVYALRADVGLTLATVTDATAKVVIRSGGLISPNNTAITPALVFGTPGTPAEGYLLVSGNTLTLGDAANTGVGQITATSLTKAGAGTLVMNADQATFTGPIYVGSGNLTLLNSLLAAGNGTSNAGTKGGTITLGADAMTLNLRSNTTGLLTFNTSLLMAAGNPLR
jgi:autotransporter-associated beta strand protein